MDDLKLIKKNYGEAMSHLCRELFPTILESDGLLFKLMNDHFYYSKDLCKDIVEYDLINNFKDYIYSLIEEDRQEKIATNKTPSELLDEAGYILYECKTEEDVQSFRKYYNVDEVLCTFTRGNRLKTNYVFFAVKKDVDNIKREAFTNPKRQDLYGTSVISIQFTKGDINTLSIKNRYNHTVTNPDATFSNNLENIIPGLTKSFEKKYNLNINSNENNLKLPGYVLASDGKFYKYNYEMNNIYYCPDNIIIDNFEVKQYDKERYIVLDYFILDMKEKTIKLYDNNLKDSFVGRLNNINKIEIKKENSNKIIILNNSNIEIKLDSRNRIIEYKNKTVKNIKSNFLFFNEVLNKIELPNAVTLDSNFLCNNSELKEIELPKVKQIYYDFLYNNQKLEKIELPNVIEIGNNFLYNNLRLKEIELPNIIKIENSFLHHNQFIKTVSLPKVECILNGFLCANRNLLELTLPKVEYIGEDFLYFNENLKKIELPNVIEISASFLDSNEKLLYINFPKLEKIGIAFINYNEVLKEFIIPNLKKIGDIHFNFKNSLEVVDIPEETRERYHYLFPEQNKIKKLAMC